MNDPSSNIVIISCAIFMEELEALHSQHQLSLPVCWLDSMLHMKPERLESILKQRVEEKLQQGHRILLVFGECSAGMNHWDDQPKVTRTNGMNCCEILLGKARYRQLQLEGAFILLPEWLRRWRDIFTTHLGLNETNGKEFMREMHRKLVYLDTGLAPVPEEILQNCAQFCGLPYEIQRVSLDHLHQNIQQALDRLNTQDV